MNMPAQPNPRPAQAVPAQAVPARPAQAFPAQAVPAQAIPARPAQAVPAQAVPARAVQAFPAQAVPAQAMPARPASGPVPVMAATLMPGVAQAVPAQAVAAHAVAAHAVAAAPAAPPLNLAELSRMERLLASMEGYKASDLHLKSGAPIVMRIKGDMQAVNERVLSSDDIRDLLYEVCSPEQRKTYEATGDLDFAHMLPNRARFRFNCFRERRMNTLVVRRVSTKIPTFQELNLPGETFEKICSGDDGLIILAGVTGSGKSSTIAGMLDYINQTFPKHIITIEDPIEYEFSNKMSYISQREIGVDCQNFKAAIRTLVRQDPDVVLVGEMRDQETFEFGLIAAETGHLVFGTLHAGTVAQSIGRVLGLFPAEKHASLRQGLEFNLRSIVCQKLAPAIDPNIGRVPINEIMIVNPSVRKLIKAGEDKKINDVIRLREDGMMTFDQCLVDRTNQGIISAETALDMASNAEQLKMMLQGISVGGKGGLT